jgi:hypothetical protein
MAGSSVCQSLVGDLTTEQRQELDALQAAYDGVLTGGRAMEQLLEDIRCCSNMKVRPSLILWLDHQIPEARLEPKD